MYIFPSCTISPEAGQFSVESDEFNGNITVSAGPGVKDWFNVVDHVEYYQKESAIEFQSQKVEGEDDLSKCLPIKFADFGTAWLCGQARYALSHNDSLMSLLHQNYRTPEGVENGLIKQALAKAAFSSGPLMTSQESNVSKRSYLLEIVQDQAQNGIYEMHFVDTSVVDVATGKSRTIKVGMPIPCTTCPGGYKRSEPSPLNTYDLKVYNLAFNIVYSNIVEKQIAAQQRTNMQMDSLAIQAKKANTEAIIAGENAKARVAEVNAKRDSSIASATAETEVARLLAEKARYEKIRDLEVAQGSAAKANVPLTARERAEIEKAIKIGIAEQLAKAPVPQLIINGDGSNKSTLEQSYGIERMLLLMQQLNNSQKKDEPRP